MIVLYQYKPAFGLPNASPFCMKVETYLRLAGLEYETKIIANPGKAPKKKLPFIIDQGKTIADSHMVLDYLRAEYGDPLGEGATLEELARHHALQRMLEEHTYFCMIWYRWLDPVNADATREVFFGFLPGILKRLIFALAQRTVRKQTEAQGIGRHSPDEIKKLGLDDIQAVTGYLGDKPYFGGDTPREIDATAYAFLANNICTPTVTPVADACRRNDNLVAYVRRLNERVFPELRIQA